MICRKSVFNKVMPCLFLFVLLFTVCVKGQDRKKRSSKYVQPDEIEEVKVDIPVFFEEFDLTAEDADYSIALCADVPNNRKPRKVVYNQQTGHVFLILQQVKKTTADTIHKVFGFYPKRGLPALIFKKIKSSIKDNSMRSYNAAIHKKLSKEDFNKALEMAYRESEKKYHINKYNCYDYAVVVFNAVAGKDTVPVTHVRFPFIFGKGGSPAGLYADLKRMQEEGKDFKPEIMFGELLAPVSTGRDLSQRK